MLIIFFEIKFWVIKSMSQKSDHTALFFFSKQEQMLQATPLWVGFGVVYTQVSQLRTAAQPGLMTGQ